MKTKMLALIVCLSAVLLAVGLTGCAGNRHNQCTGQHIDDTDDNRTEGPSTDESTDQRIEDGRTAGRVREALAAGADYKYDGVKVIAINGVVQLSGFVKTNAQRNRAGEVTGKVAGVKSVENNLAIKE
jgi:BON domain